MPDKPTRCRFCNGTGKLVPTCGGTLRSAHDGRRRIWTCSRGHVLTGAASLKSACSVRDPAVKPERECGRCKAASRFNVPPSPRGGPAPATKRKPPRRDVERLPVWQVVPLRVVPADLEWLIPLRLEMLQEAGIIRPAAPGEVA